MNRITIAPCRQPGYYVVTILRSGKSYPAIYDRLKRGDAAAKASALSAGCYGKFQILGDESILNEIRSGGIMGDSN